MFHWPMQTLPIMCQWVPCKKTKVIKNEPRPVLEIFCHEFNLARFAVKSVDAPVFEAELVSKRILAKKDKSLGHFRVFSSPQAFGIPADQTNRRAPAPQRKHMQAGLKGIEPISRCVKFSKTRSAVQQFRCDLYGIFL